jgi:hypothetical protein
MAQMAQMVFAFFQRSRDGTDTPIHLQRSAAAYGGRFVRPDDVVLASTGGSALSVAGGRSVWRDRDIKVGRSLRIRLAETSAEGLADSLRDAVRVSRRQLAAEALTATTTVSARCRGLEVGGAPPASRDEEPEPTMSIAEVGCTLVSRSARPGHESSVVVEAAMLTTITFDSPVKGRYRLDVGLDIEPFRRNDTRAKVIADRSILQVHGDRDVVFSTIVTKLEWQKGRAYPESKPLGTNGVYIPNLGAFYFGELLIQASTRRLTMIRAELGSPTGGVVVASDVDTNGTWSL